jgi:hypothetical protein
MSSWTANAAAFCSYADFDGCDKSVPQAKSQLDMGAWPAPVVKLFLGELTPEAVDASTDSTNAATKKNQVCGANFFVGEFKLLAGDKEAAKRFRLAGQAGLWASRAACRDGRAQGARSSVTPGDLAQPTTIEARRGVAD